MVTKPPSKNLTEKEIERLRVIDEVRAGQLTQAIAASILGISERQVRRLLTAFNPDGPMGLANKARGQPSNHRLPDELRNTVITLSRETYPDAGPTFLVELLLDRDEIKISHETARQLMMEANLWEASKPGKPKHRRWRERKACLGEMLQMDSSKHNWFGPDQPKAFLIALIDDATNTLFARFYETDSTATNMDVIKRYIEANGRPVSLYTDKAGHFKVNKASATDDELNPSTKEEEAITQIQRALNECDIKLIFANSPQAKGRVERLFKTLQDRLLKLMRYDSITTIEKANEYLEKYYLAKWNGRFTKKPTSNFNAHRPGKGYDLKAIFSIQKVRTVHNDYTIKLDNKRYQIESGDIQARLRLNKVTVEKRLNGDIKIRFNGRYLHFHEINVQAKS